MKPKKNSKSNHRDLRQKAQKQLAQQKIDMGPISQLTKGDIIKLVEKLNLHQVELEMQNDELRRSQAELQELQQKYFDLYNFAPFGYLVVDRESKILEMNLTLSTMLNDERSIVINNSFLRYVDLKNRDLYRQHLSLVFESGSDQTCEILLQRKNAGSFYANLQLVAIGEDCGKMKHVRIAISDITERKNLQKQIFQTAKLLSIGELAAGVGHEINNPLAIISGYLTIIKNYCKNNMIEGDQLSQAFDAQKRAIKRIQDIVVGLRTFARVDDQKDEILDMNQIAESVLAFLKIIYEKDGIQIETKLASSSYKFWGNRGKLQQVLNNVLNNAKDASEGQKQRKILFETERLSGLGVLRITDNGKGIKPEDLERVFDAFYTTKDVGKGTGLGLSITYEIIKTIGGRIQLDSTPGIGTCVNILIPLVNAGAAVVEPGISENKTNKKLSGNVLVVDDEEQLRIILVAMLEEYGMTVDTAGDGEQALSKIAEKDYDFIFTDMKMPVMGGEEMIYKLRNELNYKGKIFIVSGMVDKDISLLPIDGNLGKPYDENALLQLLRKR